MSNANAIQKLTRARNAFFLVIAISAGAIAGEGGARKDGETELAAWLNQRFLESVGQGLENAIVDDGTFLRRVYLDLVGRIPSISELRDFQSDQNLHKRTELIDRLLSSKQFGEHTARIWQRVLIPAGNNVPIQGWLATAFNENTPYDAMAHQLIVAGGAENRDEQEDAPSESAPLNVSMGAAASPITYLQNSGGSPQQMASSVSRVFLGVKLECAQCHDHPFTDWTQQDFWGFAAFFSGARLVATPQQPRANGDQPQTLVDSRSTSISDEDGNRYSVSLPWNDEDKIEIPKEQLPRQFFADWLTDANNPHFAATAVNRLWQHLCGQGLTTSVDDLDQADEDERELLDALAKKFAESGFDTKRLVRAICASRYYQSPANKDAAKEGSDARTLKVLSPEQLFDSLEVALALPIASIDRGPRFNGQREALVTRMQEAMGASPSEFRSGIPQTLALMNGQITADATDLAKSRTLRAVLDAPFLDLKEKIESLFLATLSRPPHKREMAKVLALIEEQPSEQEKADVFSQIMWGLINSPEFVLVR